MRRSVAFYLALLAAYAAYSAAWSYIALAKVYDLRVTLGDLGIIVQGAWDSVHSGVQGFVNYLAGQAALLIYAVFLPLGPHMIEALVVLQTLWLGAAAFPIFAIARRYLRSDVAALMLAVSYLIYFPLAGVNWFDVHRQALFPTLFITSYYLYLRGGRSRYISVPLMIFSSMLRFGYEVYPLWFGITLVGYWALRDRRDRFGLAAGLTLIAASLLLVAYNVGVLTALFTSPAKAVQATPASVSSTASTYLRLIPTLSQLYSLNIVVPPVAEPGHVHLLYVRGYVVDALTLGLSLLPVLFLPLLSWRWAPALLPFIALLAFSSYWGYHYPYFFRLQYPSIIMAPVWLGTIEGASLISRGSRRAATYVAAGVLIASAVTAAFFEPYGPLNYMSFTDYQLSQWTSFNMTYYESMIDVISMVPRNATMIAAQDNMPELLPRPNGDVILGCIGANQSQYVIVNVVHGLYLYYDNTDVCGESMLEVADWALRSGYGIVAEEGGTMLLERNYSGGVVAFRPYSYSYGPGDLWPLFTAWYGKGYINVTDFHYDRLEGLFAEPHALNFLPGRYNVTFYLMNEDLSPSTRLYAVVTGYYISGDGLLTQVTLLNESVPASLLPQGRWARVTLSFYSPTLVGLGSVTLLSDDVNGTLLIRGFYLTQVSPP
ncbi:DUF2079 domain-containing protein [Acidilobus sp.]|uniref:DUF2079 domain-containing protein n=1 Tax=Acidilobus sp. TaxID=1872109 RepID=UPI003D0892A0